MERCGSAAKNVIVIYERQGEITVKSSGVWEDGCLIAEDVRVAMCD